jgi:hypothetical protein
MLCCLHGSRVPILPVRRILIHNGCFKLTTFRETKLKTLEEIAAAFGDHVVDPDSDVIVAEKLAMGAKSDDLGEHVEVNV